MNSGGQALTSSIKSGEGPDRLATICNEVGWTTPESFPSLAEATSWNLQLVRPAVFVVYVDLVECGLPSKSRSRDRSPLFKSETSEIPEGKSGTSVQTLIL